MTSPNLENQNEEQEDTRTNDEVPPVPAWQSAIYEERQNRLRTESELNQAREELARLRNTSNRTPEDILEQGDTFNNPEKLMGRIRAEIDRSVAPLNQFVGEFARKDRYQQLKYKFKSQMNQEQLAVFAQVEPLMDSQFLNNSQLEPNDQTFQTVFQNVVGFISMNGGFRQINTQPTNRQPNNDGTPPVIPPNVRSNAAPVRRESTFDDSSFTENDRRIAREQRMSLEEYAIMRDTPPHKAEEAWRGIIAKRKANAAQGR